MAHHFVPNFTREVSNKSKITFSQCNIAKYLGLSPSTTHNMAKDSENLEKIPVHEGQGRKPQLNVLDLWALRWYCIRNRHAAVLNIATWAQEYFRKLLSLVTCIKKCNLNICYSRRRLHISPNAAGFSGPELITESENVCCTPMSPHFNLFSGKMDFELSVPKTKRTMQTFISNRSKSKCLSWYGGASEQMAWVTGICAKVSLTWMHILGLYRDTYYH